MMRAVSAISAVLIFVFFGSTLVEAKSSVLDDPKVAALVEARLAKVRVLSDGEFELVAERGRAAIDNNFAKLSRKDIKRLAKMGDAVWLDCGKVSEFGYEEAKTKDLSDKMKLSRVNDERYRAVFYNHMRSKLTGHEKYKSNGFDFDEAKSQGKISSWELFMAASGLKCQLSLIDVKLSGDFETGFGFYGEVSKAADLYGSTELEK